MCEEKDFIKFESVLAEMSTAFTKAMNLPVSLTLNRESEFIKVKLDGKEVCNQSIACDSYDAAVVDLCHCIKPLASAFRDTYL